jgi:hypothetical protein
VCSVGSAKAFKPVVKLRQFTIAEAIGGMRRAREETWPMMRM